MNSNLKLLPAALLVAMLALAGCGGGDNTPDSEPTPTPPPDPAPKALETAVELDSRLDDVDVMALYESAIENAGKLTTASVHGESNAAADNAQAILDAYAAIKMAVTDAQAVITEAMAAKTAAADIADATDKAAVIRLLDAAIKEAEGIKMMAEGYLDPNPGTNPATIENLLEAVRAVTDGEPSKVGGAVATAIQTALAGTIGEGAIASATDDAVLRNDGSAIQAMTWAQIVGTDNVMKVRRLVGTDVTQSDSMMVTGNARKLTSDGANPTGLTDTDTAKDGTQVADSSSFAGEYKGIPGTVFCAGSNCAVADDGGLSGSWYFTPTLAKELYVAGTGANVGEYVQATQYARYGYWLATDGSVNTYAAAGTAEDTSATITTATDVAAFDLGPDGDNDVTANYSGNAVGISVLNNSAGDAVASGHFDASVSLSARFATTPTLSGHISGFKGEAVNSGWRVVLNQVNLSNTAGSTTGVASGGGAPGVWSTQGYGTGAAADGTTPRPTGFFGRFNANFANGAAAGAYATR